jgi:hypothetical protein
MMALCDAQPERLRVNPNASITEFFIGRAEWGDWLLSVR